MDRGDQRRSGKKKLSSGGQVLPKQQLVTAVTVAIFTRATGFFQALQRKAAHLWRKSVFDYVEECTGLKGGTFQKYMYGTKAIPGQDTAEMAVTRRGPVTNITSQVMIFVTNYSQVTIFAGAELKAAKCLLTLHPTKVLYCHKKVGLAYVCVQCKLKFSL